MKKTLTWLINPVGNLLVWEGDYSNLLETGKREDLEKLENIAPLHIISKEKKQREFFIDHGHMPEEFPFLCDEWGIEELE